MQIMAGPFFNGDMMAVRILIEFGLIIRMVLAIKLKNTGLVSLL